MISQIQTGFYNALKGWETTASTASSTFNTIAPQAASFPYVTFGLLTESPMGDFADFEAVENLTYWVNCFSSKSVADVCSMADHVLNALDNVVVSASGFTSMKVVREFVGSTIFDTETNIYQMPLRYRVWLDKT